MIYTTTWKVEKTIPVDKLKRTVYKYSSSILGTWPKLGLRVRFLNNRFFLDRKAFRTLLQRPDGRNWPLRYDMGIEYTVTGAHRSILKVRSSKVVSPKLALEDQSFVSW